MMKNFVLAGLLVLAPAIFARTASAPPPNPDQAQFAFYCLTHRTGAAEFLLPKAPQGISFVPTAALEASQSRYSFERFVSALKKDLRNSPDAYVDPFANVWRFGHDEGRSLLPIHKTITGVFYRGRVHIVDGHHKALSSVYLGAKTIPVSVIGDWSHLSETEFDAEMEKNHYSYFRNYRGARMKRRDLCDLVDDGNLQLARFLFRKIDVKFDGENFNVLKTSGSELPIMLKINDDIPFFYF